ncbi:MAG: 3'-5' exonuclease [Alistipes sp.]
MKKFQNKISNEETAQLSAIEFTGEIRIVEEERDILAACKYLETQQIIGFDTETRPSFRPGAMNRVALLQLSSSNLCFLFRLNKIPFDKSILKILESKTILKVGADVAGDLRALNQIRRFRDGGFVELQKLIGDWGIEEKSLRKMSAIVLGKRVSKAQRLSNWEATHLTDKQQMYAATDAWVSTAIYDKLQHTPKIKRKKDDSTNTPA